MSTRNSIKKQRAFVLAKQSDQGYIFIRALKTPKCLWHKAWMFMVAMSREYLYKKGVKKSEWHLYVAIPINNFNCAQYPYELPFLEHHHIAEDNEEDDSKLWDDFLKKVPGYANKTYIK